MRIANGVYHRTPKTTYTFREEKYMYMRHSHKRQRRSHRKGYTPRNGVYILNLFIYMYVSLYMYSTRKAYTYIHRTSNQRTNQLCNPEFSLFAFTMLCSSIKQVYRATPYRHFLLVEHVI